MPGLLRNSVLFVVLIGVIPVAGHTAAVGGARDCCCRVCAYPCGRCVCAAPRPVCPQCQQRDVLTTEYRTEPVTETVPTTIYENALVDEGSYQTVWVPRLTTKAVAKTVYQNRTSYRSVPYQVTRRVSDCNLAGVPYQSASLPPLATSGLAYGTPSTPIVSSFPYGYTGTPIVGTVPVTSPIIASSPAVTGPVPDPKFASAPATPITPRSASAGAGSSATASSSTIKTAVNGPSLFTPAPSAAQVWRTPRGSAIR